MPVDFKRASGGSNAGILRWNFALKFHESRSHFEILILSQNGNRGRFCFVAAQIWQFITDEVTLATAQMYWRFYEYDIEIGSCVFGMILFSRKLCLFESSVFTTLFLEPSYDLPTGG